MDNRRLFLAALLSIGVLMLWQWLLPPSPPVDRSAEAIREQIGGAPAPSSVPGSSSETSGVPASPSSGPPGSDPRQAGEDGSAREASPEPRAVLGAEREETIELGNDRFIARFSNRGGQLVSFGLLDYHRQENKPLELVRERGDNTPYPFAWVSSDELGSGEELALNRELFAVTRPSRSSVAFRYSGPLGIAEKTFELNDQGFLDVSIELREPSAEMSDWGIWLGPGLRNPAIKELSDRFQKKFRRASYELAGEVDDLEVSKVEVTTLLPEAASWVALEDKYFLTALIPQSPLRAVVAVPLINRVVDEKFVGFEPMSVAAAAADDASWELALVVAPAGDRLSAEAYWGAKEYVTLRSLPFGLERTVRWGMFGFVSKPLLYGLRWLHEHIAHNYGWAIVLMTFLIKVVLFPLTHKSYVSMQRMQKLNPRMEGIRARYRPKLKDKQGRPNLEMQRKMNEEMQALFKEEGVSPVGGCLPILLQMPIFFGFYQLLSQTVELWNAPWIAWITDLTERDPYFVLPLVMGATQLAQTRMMPPSSNPSQRIIMTTMPIWFTVLAFGFPSGLVLYWLTNNVLTIIQQGGFNRLKKAGFFGGPEPASGAALKKEKANV